MPAVRVCGAGGRRARHVAVRHVRVVIMTADHLRAWQAHMGLTQRAAADALGVTQAAYSRWVTGATPIDLRTALACAALAAGLGPWPAQSTR